MFKTFLFCIVFLSILSGCGDISSLSKEVKNVSNEEEKKEAIFQKIDLGYMVEGQKFFSFVINTETSCIYVLQTERDLRPSKATEQVLTHRNLTPIAEQDWDNDLKKCVGYYQDKLNK